jgi:hypothetical protein
MTVDNEGSSATLIASSRKRVYADDASTEIPVQVWHDEESWLDEEVSPRTAMPSTWGNARVFAVPRGTRGKRSIPSTMAASLSTPEGQENTDDFPEADFLVDLEMGNS